MSNKNVKLDDVIFAAKRARLDLFMFRVCFPDIPREFVSKQLEDTIVMMCGVLGDTKEFIAEMTDLKQSAQQCGLSEELCLELIKRMQYKQDCDERAQMRRTEVVQPSFGVD